MSSAVFLSYASQDADAARRICDALRAAGVEVWFDQSELVGGDQWDAKIRGQISSCALFMPIISANTQARLEGYFRLEWKLAGQRTHTMADAKPFLLPVVTDATRDAEAHVPAEFKSVQWTKLIGGETPPAFAQRVIKLLGGEAIGGASRPDSSEASGHKAPPTIRPSRPWLVPVIFGAVAITVATVWLTRKPATASGLSSPVSSAASAALTPAQQLVDKARTILEEGDELNRETYALAEELLLKAEALDVTEASAWVLHANVSASRINYGLDPSAARHEALRTQTARAIQLAPESLDAQLAECEAFFLFEQDSPGVITRLQALAAKHPDDWRVAELLSQCYLVVRKLDEAVAANTRAMQLSPDNPRLKSYRINLLIVAGRWAEAETSIATMLQGRTGARLLAHDVYLKLMWSGDLAGAAIAVQSWPAWFLLEDRGVGHAALVALWNRDPGSALEVVRKFPRDYIRDFLFTGPSAVLSAWADEQAGNVESARADWRVVQRVAERELQSTPNDPFALHWKAWALARLGDTSAATSILQQLLEKSYFNSAMGQVVGRWGALAQTVGRTDLALAQIALNPPGSRAITKTNLRLNPVFDPLRSDPRFQAVFDAAPGPAKRPEERAATDVAPDAKSVAVLPFANLSGDKEQEYFSDGLTEEILNALARERDLHVPGRSSSFSFKGKNLAAAEIAKALGVTQLVEGSVRRSGNRVRISVSLTRAADGFSEEIGTFTEELADVFALEDKVARAVVEKLTHRASPGAPAVVALTSSPEAYDAYLRGRALQTRSAQNAPAAARYYEQAVAIDPKFALAWTRLASARLRLLGAGADSSAELIASVRFAIARALDAQPNLPEALIVRANLVRSVNFDFPAAARDLNAAGSLQPPTADLRRAQAMLAWDEGQSEVTLHRYREAMELDPQDGDLANAAGFYFEFPSEVRAADEIYRRAMAIQGPEERIPFTNRVLLRRDWRGPEAALRLVDRAAPSQAGRELARAGLLVALGRMSEARPIVEAAARTVKDTQSVDFFSFAGIDLDLLSAVGLTAMARQDAETLRAVAERELQRGNGAHNVRARFIRAEIFLGHTESALAALADWRREAESWPSVLRRSTRFSMPASALYGKLGRAGDTVAIIREMWAHGIRGGFSLAWDPSYDRVRNDPEFQRLLKEEAAWWAAQPDPVDL